VCFVCYNKQNAYVCVNYILQATNKMKKQYIPRKKYINKIKPFIDKELIKIFVGQRRVGKSYLMYQIIDFLQKEDENKHIIYINEELNEFEAIKRRKKLRMN